MILLINKHGLLKLLIVQFVLIVICRNYHYDNTIQANTKMLRIITESNRSFDQDFDKIIY